MTIDNGSALAALREALGADGVRTGDDIPARNANDWSTAAPVAPLALLRPRSTAEVSAALRICHAHGIPVTPQGGLTGLVGGATPVAGGVALTLERMNGVEEIDTATATATAMAGTPMEAVQRAADAAGLYYALDIGARGSCTVGGNIGTNAGGNRVLRYGMARELVLGLEAVLPDGTVVSALNKMLKNNTGLDLKQIFIGTEGIFGVVTRAVLRLHPKPLSVANALVRCPDFSAIVTLLRRGQSALAGTLSSFEVMWPSYYETMTRGLPELRRPLAYGPGIYVLVEATGAEPEADAERFAGFLGTMLEEGVLNDAVIAKSEKEGRELWALRDAVSEYNRVLGPIVSFDISFPIGEIGRIVAQIEQRLAERFPGIRALSYGHVGDSNLHLVTDRPKGLADPDQAIGKVVYETVREFHGSVSAEHGIGILKRNYLGYTRSPAEIALMQTLKRAIDPKNIMNPGKVLPA
ncbi:MAG: FAD-binding oxidoreductase [Rhodospirillaceae bacterium]|nr:FAD-binding oxidoreductase [Rhodospirillaceae bacterium]